MDATLILADLHSLEDEIVIFERKHGMSSESLYAAYVSGEEPAGEDQAMDFGEWASVFRTWRMRQAALHSGGHARHHP